MNKREKIPNPLHKPEWDKVKDIFKALAMKLIAVDEAIMRLADKGYTPNIISDRENRMWAFVPESVFQEYEKPDLVDISVYIFTNKKNFKGSIRAAVLYFMTPEEEYADDDIIVYPDGSYKFFTPKINS